LEAKFLAAFNAVKEHMASEVPELGNIITHWEDPFSVTKNRTVMLPDAHAESGGRITFSFVLWISIAEKNADAIAKTQMSVMEKIYRAVHGCLPMPIIGAEVESAEYGGQTPQSMNTGILRVVIDMIVDFADDCN